MWVLAIETSTRDGSVALRHTRDATADSLQIPRELSTAQRLVVTLQALLQRRQVSPADLGLVAVSQGPGSFTGVRVGMTAAKTLAFALQIPVIGVCAMQTLAAQTPVPLRARRVWTLIDAQRGELIGAGWHCHADLWQRAGDVQRRSRSQWRALLVAEDVVIASAAVIERLDRESVGSDPAAPTLARVSTVPQAATVARLALDQYDPRQAPGDTWNLTPAYHRRSAAEEKATDRP